LPPGSITLPFSLYSNIKKLRTRKHTSATLLQIQFRLLLIELQASADNFPALQIVSVNWSLMQI
jgi:hypothetical protein